MPTRQQLDRLAALESGLGRGHTSTATYDPQTEDPADVFAQLVAAGKVAPGRGVMMIPMQLAADEWERETARQQAELIEESRARASARRSDDGR